MLIAMLPDFMPNGYSFFWDPLVLWLNVFSDALIAASYYCIPVILVYFVRKNREIPFHRIFWMFGGFILACGTTHVLEIWKIWHGSYLLAGAMKAVSAALPMWTAALLIPLMPKVISVPARLHLQESNFRLARELLEHKKYDTPIDTRLRRRVTAATVLAAVLISLMGILSWRSRLSSSADGDSVTHTHAVMRALETAKQHVTEVVTSSRDFALSGNAALLAHYRATQGSAQHDAETIRHLTADNPLQQRRVDLLDLQINAALRLAETLVAKRLRSNSTLDAEGILETETVMAAAGGTIGALESEESELLRVRTQRTAQGRRDTDLVIGAGALLGVILLALAGVAIRRQVDIGARARAQVSALNVSLEQGVQERTAALQIEIAERKRAEEVLREQAQVLDSTQVFVLDLQCRIVFWPRGAEKLYGFTPQEALGVVSHDLFHTEFPEPLETVERKLFETGAWEGELLHRKRDNTVIVVASAWVLHRDAQGRPMRILETNTDVTERKRAEERLAAQAEELCRQTEELARSQQALEAKTRMLQLVLDSMGEGLIAADREGHFLIWNHAANKLVGDPETELPSAAWWLHYDVLLPDGLTPFPPDQLPLAQALLGVSKTAEMTVRRPGEPYGKYLEVSGRPMHDAHGNLCGGVAAFRDVTERKAAEEQVQRLNQELEARVVERTAELQAANKELEAFTYSVSHDLRAPLRHMSGFTRILLEDYGPTVPPEAQQYMKRIEQGAQRMGTLVDELLSLTRVGRQSLNVQVTGLASIVKDVISILQPEIEGRSIEWKIENLPFVECDPGLIRQVFQNLIGNALKYSRPRARAVIEIGQSEKDGKSLIFVRDNGVGFSMKYADKLFGVFQRLHRSEDFEGTGVGLATVARIIQKHGGQVWAEAELDRGATFYFTLGSSAAAVTKQAAAGGE